MQKNISSFLWGFVAALCALIAELMFFVIFDYTSTSSNVSLEFLVIPKFLILFAFIEEMSKFIIFSKVIAKTNRNLDVIIFNTLLMGAGFGTMELIMLNLKNPATFVSFDSLAIWLLHIGTAGLFAIICKDKYAKSSSLIGIAIATSLHALFNFLFQQSATAQTPWVIILLVVLGVYISTALLSNNARLRSV